MSGSSKSSSEAACIDRSCFAQVVYGTDHVECFGASPGELWLYMSNEMFSSPPSGLNNCYGTPCFCPMQPQCYKLVPQDGWVVGQLYEMACTTEQGGA